jgi:hypothetical protein
VFPVKYELQDTKTQLTSVYTSRRELPLRAEVSRQEQAISLRYETALVLLSRGEYTGLEGGAFMSLNRYIDCTTHRLIYKDLNVTSSADSSD